MRLLSLLILLSITINLSAQSTPKKERWIGLNNLFFKHQEMATEFPSTINDTNSVVINRDMGDHQFSFGVSLRKVDEDGRKYQQFDFLSVDRNKQWNTTTVSNNVLFEPISGQETKEFNVLTAYQRGALLPTVGRLTGDIGVRGFLWYKQNT